VTVSVPSAILCATGRPDVRLHTLTMLDTGLILKTKLFAATDFDQK
jgi:hypothetical protein